MPMPFKVNRHGDDLARRNMQCGQQLLRNTGNRYRQCGAIARRQACVPTGKQ
ncbi:hypothetical protein D3C76_1797630 [compost metagenome]